MSNSYCDWMSRLSPEIKNLPINKIAIPGTHDSCTHIVNFDVALPVGKDYTIFRNIVKMLPCIKKIVTDWTITNDLSISNQLSHGIRYFDIRMSFSNNDFYTSHTFACQKFSDILKQIYNFVTENTSEVVILDVDSDSINKATLTDKYNDLLTLIKNIIGAELFYPYTEGMTMPKYIDMVTMNKRIILFSDLLFNNVNDPIIFPYTPLLNCPWDTSNDVTTLESEILSDINGFNPSCFNVSTFGMSPTNATVENDVKNRILKCFTYKSQSVRSISIPIQDYIDSNVIKAKIPENIITCYRADFPSKEFIDKVLAINSLNSVNIKN